MRRFHPYRRHPGRPAATSVRVLTGIPRCSPNSRSVNPLRCQRANTRRIANARALAVKFQLPDGKNADILALHIEGFPARTPDEFLAFLRAQLPDRLPASLYPMQSPAFSTVIPPLAPSLSV